MKLLAKKTYTLNPDAPIEEIKKNLQVIIAGLNVTSHNSKVLDFLFSQDGTVYNRFAIKFLNVKDSDFVKLIALYNFDDEEARIEKTDSSGMFGMLGLAMKRVALDVMQNVQLFLVSTDKNGKRLLEEPFCKQISDIVLKEIEPYKYRCTKCGSTEIKLEFWSNEDPKFDLDKIAHGVTAVLLLNPVTRGHGSAYEWSKATAKRMKRTGMTYTCTKCGETRVELHSEEPVK